MINRKLLLFPFTFSVEFKFVDFFVHGQNIKLNQNWKRHEIVLYRRWLERMHFLVCLSASLFFSTVRRYEQILLFLLTCWVHWMPKHSKFQESSKFFRLFFATMSTVLVEISAKYLQFGPLVLLVRDRTKRRDTFLSKLFSQKIFHKNLFRFSLKLLIAIFFFQKIYLLVELFTWLNLKL